MNLDDFINPPVYKISKTIKEQKDKEYKIPKSYTVNDSKIPPELTPFLETNEITELIKAIKRNPFLL